MNNVFFLVVLVGVKQLKEAGIQEIQVDPCGDPEGNNMLRKSQHIVLCTTTIWKIKKIWSLYK